MRRIALFAVAALAVGVPSDSLAKFGISKTRVTLPRLRPPEMRVLAERLTLEVSSGAPEVTGSHVALVRGRLEQAVLSSGLFELAERGPDADAAIRIRLDALAAEVRDEVRIEKRRVKIGEKQVWNEKKKRYEQEDVYGDRDEPVAFRLAEGSVNATLEVEDSSGRVTRDASALYSESYRLESGVPAEVASEESLRRHLLSLATEQVVALVCYATDPIEALLAVDGELKVGNRLAEQGRFAEARGEWERTRYKGDKEAARLHNVGVALEGLAYEAPPHSAEHLDRLLKARDHYRAALELDPDEKYFKDPLERIEVSLALAGQAAALAAELARFAQARPAPTTSTGADAPGSAHVPLRNGSFESSLVPWSLRGAGSVVSESGRGRVLELKAGAAGAEAQQAIGVDVGASATLGLEYQVTAGESRIRVLLDYLDAGGRPRTSTLEITAGEGPAGWLSWSVELGAVRPRPARANRLAIVAEGGVVRLDNVALTLR